MRVDAIKGKKETSPKYRAQNALLGSLDFVLYTMTQNRVPKNIDMEGCWYFLRKKRGLSSVNL